MSEAIAMSEWIRLVGPNQAVEILGVKLVGVTGESGDKLIIRSCSSLPSGCSASSRSDSRITRSPGDAGIGAPARPLSELQRRYFMEAPDLTPKTFLRLTDSWIEIAVRFLTAEHGTWTTPAQQCHAGQRLAGRARHVHRTFAYCLLVLRTVQGDGGDGYEAFVPHLAVSGSMVLTLFSVAMLIYYVHHVAVSMQVAAITARVVEDLEASIDRIYPDELGTDESTDDPPLAVPAGATLVRSSVSGYVQEVVERTKSG